MFTSTNYIPFGNWSGVAGLHAPPPDSRIWIMPEGFANFKENLTTLAHELAHAYGVTDEQLAEILGDNAYNAYVADGGAKCGGLAP